MDIQQLFFFCAVARTNHITRASKELYISQPALSSSMARLEKELGMPLFVRTGRNIMLNDAGNLFFEFAKKTCAEYEHTAIKMAQLNSASRNVIKIGSSSQRSFTESLGYFIERHPNEKITYYSNNPSVLTQMLRDGELDLCITSPPINAKGISTKVICNEEIKIALSKKHRFANRETIALSELKYDPFIGLNSDYHFRNMCEEFCRQAGFMPQYAFEVNYSTIQEINKTGSLEQYVTFAPAKFCNERYSSEQNRVFLHVSDVECFREIGISWRESRIIDSDFSSLVDTLTEAYIKMLE